MPTTPFYPTLQVAQKLLQSSPTTCWARSSSVPGAALFSTSPPERRASTACADCSCKVRIWRMTLACGQLCIFYVLSNQWNLVLFFSLQSAKFIPPLSSPTREIWLCFIPLQSGRIGSVHSSPVRRSWSFSPLQSRGFGPLLSIQSAELGRSFLLSREKVILLFLFNRRKFGPCLSSSIRRLWFSFSIFSYGSLVLFFPLQSRRKNETKQQPD